MLSKIRSGAADTPRKIAIPPLALQCAIKSLKPTLILYLQEAPSLSVGDVLVFSKCTVDTCTVLNCTVCTIHCTVLYYVVLYYAVLCCTMMYCTVLQVHTCSGLNTARRPRHAWQIRFFSEPQACLRDIVTIGALKEHSRSFTLPREGPYF